MSNNNLKYRQTLKGVLRIIYINQKTKQKRTNITVNYTYEEFKNYFIDDEIYLKIYLSWVESGYDKQKKPSVDRINPKGNYEFKNIQIMTWEENNNKGIRERLKKVFMIDKKSNKIIRTFNSLLNTERFIGIKNSRKNISSCCNGRIKSAYGYKWKYEKE